MSIITLTTDIGQKDYLVGAIKGQLLSINTGFTVVDISHNISPFNYPEAAYIFKNSFHHFPDYSFHLVLVNLFDTKQDHLLLAYHQKQYIACADNGLLTMILDEPPEHIISIPFPTGKQRTTLACTAMWGNSIANFLAGAAFGDLGNEVEKIVEKLPLKPSVHDNWMEAHIIHIDHFENVVVNITETEFEEQRKDRKFKIFFRRDETVRTISETYADVPENEKLALFNSAGYLEIAINKGNAAGLFGLQLFKNSGQAAYQQSRMFYQTVRIEFLDN